MPQLVTPDEGGAGLAVDAPVHDPQHAPDRQSLDPLEECTLPQPDREERMAWVEREILPHATEIVRLDRGLAIELGQVPGLAARVDRLIELERECCSGIVFERLAGATPGGVRLEIHGIDPDAAVFRALQLPSAAMPARSRFALAAGAGVFGSVFVCCVLPIAAAALVGAAAAPLASLDGPVPIAAGAVIGGVLAWRWLGRGGSAVKATASDRPCGEGC